MNYGASGLNFENIQAIRNGILHISRFLDEQSQERGSEKLTKRQCQALYPDGNDSTLFFDMKKS